VTAKRSALIVATSQYKDPRLPRLDAPAEDAAALRAVLANPEIGGFDVRVALNSRVETLRRTLETFFADRARDDLLLVHFSGHGLKDDDGQLYLAAADTQLDRLLSTGVDAVWINRLMARCRSETIALFLDCCFAGAFTSGLTRRVAGDTAGVKEAFQGRGLFVIAASDAMQYSFEGGRQVGEPPEPSAFTKALVDGLATGLADRNEDGQVSINELFDFLEDRVRVTSPSQTPMKSAINQVGDWMIARSTRVVGANLLPEALRAHISSENPLDRVSALFDLRRLIEGPDARVAEAATEAVRKLATDDSKTVSARAQSLLDEEAARPRGAPEVLPAPRPARRRRRPPPAPPVIVPPVQPEGDDVGGGPLPRPPESPPRVSLLLRTRAAIALRRPRGRTLQAVIASVVGLAAVVVAVVVSPLLSVSGQPTPTPSSGSVSTPLPSRTPGATTSLPRDRLAEDQDLKIGNRGRGGAGGDYLIDPTGRHMLLFLTGGDVGVLDLLKNTVLWHADTVGAAQLYLQGDGNLVIHAADGDVLWDVAEQSAGGPFELILRVGGNLELRRAGVSAPIWSSQTDGGCMGGWCKTCLQFHCATPSPQGEVVLPMSLTWPPSPRPAHG